MKKAPSRPLVLQDTQIMKGELDLRARRDENEIVLGPQCREDRDRIPHHEVVLGLSFIHH